jgi:hypothetical protein
VSIIHEALQKTQQNLRNKPDNGWAPQKETTPVERIDMLLVVTIAALLIIIIVTYYSRLTSYSTAKPVPETVSSPKPVTSLQPAQPMVSQTLQPMMVQQPVQPIAMYQPAPVVMQPQFVQWVAPQPQFVQVVAAPQPMMQPQMQFISAPPSQTMAAAPSSLPPQTTLFGNDKGKLTLNGVLLADQEKIAMVNNQPYHLGDSIEGMKIVSIELNSITLQDGTRTMVLRT